MRKWGMFAGLATVGLCVGVACSSSDDAAAPAPPVEAGTDAPVGPPDDGGTDGDTGTGTDTGVQHAGTRIKLRGVETSEGTFLYTSPYDSMLGAVCYPVRTIDGVLRCVPIVDATVSVFADTGCTIPLASSPKGSCAKPALAGKATSSSTDFCDTRFTLYRTGAAVAAAKVYTMNGGAGCAEATPPPDTEFYSVLSQVPDTDLVTFTETLVPLTPDLGAYVLDGSDGSRIQRSYFGDTKRGKPCEPNLAGDRQMRCTPRAKATTDGFSDMTCATGAADPRECVVAYELFDDTTATKFETGPKCSPYDVRAFTLGAKRASRDEFRSDGDGGCTGPLTSPRDVYDLGAEIVPATMPAMTPAPTGGPRLVGSTLVSGGVVAQQLTDRVSDTMLGGSCHFVTAADGKLRCLPDGAGVSFFSDIQCSVPLGVQVDECEPVKYLLRDDHGACPVQHVYLPGTKLDPASTPAYQGTGPADCALIGSSNSIAYYTLGAEVPASSFEEGTYVTK